ncbi:MAG: response regulator [Betaproteobacteria bacterium]|nr:response regulator [Betaproteobacteria bacterium]
MPARILIAEDNRASLELVEYLLGTRGYTTRAASNGGEGLRIAREMVPDLVICDLQMPVLNGYEVVRVLKADPLLGPIPVIALTAYSMPGDRDKAIAAGFNGYLSKPIDPETFIAEIEHFLRPELRARRTENGSQSEP